MQLYQEIIFREKPDFILQTGVCGGGSIVYFSSILDMMNAPNSTKVIGIDIELSEQAKTIKNDRVLLFEGSSIDQEIFKTVTKLVEGKKGLIILDSDHSKDHVTKELSMYYKLVDIGCRLVVEDTNLNGNPVYPAFGPGPFEAVCDFLSANDNFISDDKLWKRNLFSFHQYGWLKKIK
jgi:cephalosporin hydroxylase